MFTDINNVLTKDARELVRMAGTPDFEKVRSLSGALFVHILEANVYDADALASILIVLKVALQTVYAGITCVGGVTDDLSKPH